MRFRVFPFARYIDINDFEEVLRAIQMTDDEAPVDMVLHTPGWAALQRKPFATTNPRSPFALITIERYALVATKSSCASIVLGAIDPQLGLSRRRPCSRSSNRARSGNRGSDLDPSDQGLILDFRYGLLFDDLEQGRGRRISELRIDSAEDGVLAHDDFVGRERNKRASRHRVMRHKDGDLGFVVANGLRWSAARTNPPGVWRTMSSGTSSSVIWMARRTSSESLMSM